MNTSECDCKPGLHKPFSNVFWMATAFGQNISDNGTSLQCYRGQYPDSRVAGYFVLFREFCFATGATIPSAAILDTPHHVVSSVLCEVCVRCV